MCMCNAAFFRGPAHRCSANTVPLAATPLQSVLLTKLFSCDCSPLLILSEASVHSGSAEHLLTSWPPWLFPPRSFWGVFLYQLWPLHTTTSPSAWFDLGQASCFLPLPGTSWIPPDQAGSLPVPLSTPRSPSGGWNPTLLSHLTWRRALIPTQKQSRVQIGSGKLLAWEPRLAGALFSTSPFIKLAAHVRLVNSNWTCRYYLENSPSYDGGSWEFLQLRTLFTDSLQP